MSAEGSPEIFADGHVDELVEFEMHMEATRCSGTRRLLMR